MSANGEEFTENEPEEETEELGFLPAINEQNEPVGTPNPGVEVVGPRLVSDDDPNVTGGPFASDGDDDDPPPDRGPRLVSDDDPNVTGGPFSSGTERRAVENRRAGALGGSADPAFRGDIFRDPAEQLHVRERLEQQIRESRGLGPGQVELETGEVRFERVDGRIVGRVSGRDAFDVGPANNPTRFGSMLLEEAARDADRLREIGDPRLLDDLEMATDLAKERQLAREFGVGGAGLSAVEADLLGREIGRRAETGAGLPLGAISSDLEAAQAEADLEREFASGRVVAPIDDLVRELERRDETGAGVPLDIFRDIALEEGRAAPRGDPFAGDPDDRPIYFPEDTTLALFGDVGGRRLEDVLEEQSAGFRKFGDDLAAGVVGAIGARGRRRPKTVLDSDVRDLEAAFGDPLGVDDFDETFNQSISNAVRDSVAIADPFDKALLGKEVVYEALPVVIDETLAGRGGQLADVREADNIARDLEADLDELLPSSVPRTGLEVGFLEGGAAGDIKRSGFAAGEEAFEALETQSRREGIIPTAAGPVATLALTAGGIGAASRLSPTAGRAVATTVQPGEEFASFAATKAFPGTAKRFFPGGRIDNEEIILREVARAGRGVEAAARRAGRAAAAAGEGIAARTPRFEVSLVRDLEAGPIDVDLGLRRDLDRLLEDIDRRAAAVGAEVRSAPINAEIALETVRGAPGRRAARVRGAASDIDADLRRRFAEAERQVMGTLQGAEMSARVAPATLRKSLLDKPTAQLEAEFEALSAEFDTAAEGVGAEVRSAPINARVAMETAGRSVERRFADIDRRFERLGSELEGTLQGAELSARAAVFNVREGARGFDVGSLEADLRRRFDDLERDLSDRALGAAFSAEAAMFNVREGVRGLEAGLPTAPSPELPSLELPSFDIPDPGELTLRVRRRPRRPPRRPFALELDVDDIDAEFSDLADELDKFGGEVVGVRGEAGPSGGLSGVELEVELERRAASVEAEFEAENRRQFGRTEADRSGAEDFLEVGGGELSGFQIAEVSIPSLELEIETEFERRSRGLEADLEAPGEFAGPTEAQTPVEITEVFTPQEYGFVEPPELEIETEIEVPNLELEIEAEPFNFGSDDFERFDDLEDVGGFFSEELDFPARRRPFRDFTRELEAVSDDLERDLAKLFG